MLSTLCAIAFFYEKKLYFDFIDNLTLHGSCMTKSNKEIFIVPFERGYEDISLNLDTISNQIAFSDAFWNHFTSTFPIAVIALFNRQDDEFDNIIKLSHHSYDYGLISDRNRMFLLNHLPQNLSKEESTSYWQNTGFFLIPDTTDISEIREPEIPGRQWIQASNEVKQEYLLFFSLVADHDKEYALIAKKTLIESILKKYQ